MRHTPVVILYQHLPAPLCCRLPHRPRITDHTVVNTRTDTQLRKGRDIICSCQAVRLIGCERVHIYDVGIGGGDGQQCGCSGRGSLLLPLYSLTQLCRMAIRALRVSGQPRILIAGDLLGLLLDCD